MTHPLALLFAVASVLPTITEPRDTCGIELVEVLRLGSEDDPGWRSRASRVAWLEGDVFFVSPRYAPPQVSSYGPDGRFMGLFDRTGGGPGELPGGFIIDMTAGGGGLHVLSANRVLSLDEALGPTGTTTLPFTPTSVARLGSGGFAVVYPLIREGGWRAIHVVDVDGSLIGSVEPQEGPEDRLPWRLTEASDGGFWAIDREGRRVHKYDQQGNRQRSWSLERSPADVSPRPADGEPRVVGAQELRGDRLLVASLVAEGPSPQALAASTDFDAYLDTLLEIIDTRTGSIIAAHRSARVIEPVRGSAGLVFRTEEMPSGDVQVVVFRVTAGCVSP